MISLFVLVFYARTLRLILSFTWHEVFHIMHSAILAVSELYFSIALVCRLKFQLL